MNENKQLPIKEIRKLAELFHDNQLEELLIETEELCVKFSKGTKSYSSPIITPGLNIQQVVPPTPITQQPQQPLQAPRQQPSISPEPTKTQQDPFADETKYHKVKSPINGTFYRAPSPGAEPFVKEGDHVNAGQTLCIVEAMKVMNEIKSPVSGKIVKILKNNAEIVKSEDALMIIEMV
ncbi:MAG: acetyl-CoA carboxylase biotin carboxyl carrier protein [Brevinematia bacterium]